MASTEALRERLAELRRSFDDGFSQPLLETREDTLDVLSIRVGKEPYALRLSEVGALEADRAITRLPSEHSALLGIAGVRGLVVAVFDLAALLGVSSAESARWIALAKGAPLALAFSGFEGQISAHPEQFARAEAGTGLREVLRHDGINLPLINLPALVASLDPRQGTAARRGPG